MRQLSIDGTLIKETSPCYVIAEIGHNHMGDVQIAKDMFKAAKDCGANAVKLQKRDSRSLFVKDLYYSPYTSENSYGSTYGAHREALEFGRKDYLELKQYAKEIGITMFATAFDYKSADFLADLDIPAYKIASGDLTSTPFLKYVAGFGKPMIISTGGGTIDDVKRVYDTIMPINTNFCFLQCTAAYPVYDYSQLNIKVITQYMQEFPDKLIGLSDHESGISMAILAYALGARIIEKHFTLNRSWKGTDHAFSLSPSGLKRIVRNLQRAHQAMGDGIKCKYPCEEKPLLKMSKKLVAAKKLSNGHILTQEDIALKSPGDGIAPYELENLIGKTLKKDLEEDGTFTWEILA